MDLLDQVWEVSNRYETKAEIVAYYQANYPGRGAESWKQHLVHDLAAITGMKPKNLERRFDPSRLHNVPRTAREKEQYVELGLQLPPISPPENGYHIYGEVFVKFSDGECEPRDVDEYITGEDAEELLDQARASGMAQAVVKHYMEDALWDEPSARIGDCDPPNLTVEAIE